MRKFCIASPVTRKIYISDNIIQLTLKTEEISKAALPGQFIQVRVADDFVPLWPRPFSIFDVNPEKEEISIIFKKAGKGTKLLAQKEKGDPIHIFGPLGKGFSVPSNGGKIIMAAGGIGLPPLFLLAKFSIGNGIPGESITFISGAKTKSELFDSGNLREMNMDLHICTDDGSAGKKGTVVDLLNEVLGSGCNPTVYACGPSAMLKKIDLILVKRGLSGFLSLEQLMPCGYGICSGCAVKVFPPGDRGPTDDNRDYHLKRVCVDGPVFKAGEVMWP